jgi:hypothetical protein
MDKCLFVITGDTFRLGGQRSPNKGGEESYNRQRLATDSHNRFFKNIEEKFNVKCDLFLNIYKCNDEYDSDFLQWYGDRVVECHLHPERMEGEMELAYDTMSKLSQLGIDEYRFVMLIRPDWYLKKYFVEIFDIDDERVLYAHLDGGYPIKEDNGRVSFLAYDNEYDFPYVCHCITYCPRKYFQLLLQNQVWHWHDSLMKLMNHVPRKDIGFFIDTFHWCCSSLDWNPLYSLVGRGEHLEYKMPNITYNFETNTIQHVDTIERYQNVLYTDTIEENLKNYE